MSTLEYIIDKYNLGSDKGIDVSIPGFGRHELATLLNELGFKSIVEVGVCDGVYSEFLCKTNPDAKIYGVDPFVRYEGYRDYVQENTVEMYHEKAKKLMAPYPNYTLIEKFSMDAVKDFEDNSLDFVYIDANHEDPWVSEDIQGWYKKVRSGGILSGHDYVMLDPNNHAKARVDVREAVLRFTRGLGLKKWFVTTVDDREIRRRDRRRSWIIVKP
jgi:hypothetical protein